jgi:hypothetical protein
LTRTAALPLITASHRPIAIGLRSLALLSAGALLALISLLPLLIALVLIAALARHALVFLIGFLLSHGASFIRRQGPTGIVAIRRSAN